MDLEFHGVTYASVEDTETVSILSLSNLEAFINKVKLSR